MSDIAKAAWAIYIRNSLNQSACLPMSAQITAKKISIKSDRSFEIGHRQRQVVESSNFRAAHVPALTYRLDLRAR